MLEENQLPHRHFAPGGRVVVLEHIEDGLPEELKVLLRETGGLAGQVCRDIALAAVEPVGDDVLAAHFGALFLGVGLGGDGDAGDGDLLGEHRVHAAGEAQLDRAAHLAAVEGRLDKGSHHRAEGADVKEIGAHPVPDFGVDVRVFFLVSLMVFSSTSKAM